jgi:sortase A
MTTAPPPTVSEPPRPPRKPRRSLGRRIIRDVSSVLIIAGLLLILDAGLTLLWQEPVTAVIGLLDRGQISQRYLSYRTVPLPNADRAAFRSLRSESQEVAFLARQESAEVPNGAAIGTLEIPAISVDYEVVQGTDTADLERGPGHYPSTALPGLDQTVAIAGHRTTYLAPFRNLNELHRGQRIVLRMPYATFTYRIQYLRIVTPDAWWITDNHGYDRLVLSACNPLYSAAQRIVVFARMVGMRPNAAALREVASTRGA